MLVNCWNRKQKLWSIFNYTCATCFDFFPPTISSVWCWLYVSMANIHVHAPYLHHKATQEVRWDETGLPQQETIKAHGMQCLVPGQHSTVLSSFICDLCYFSSFIRSRVPSCGVASHAICTWNSFLYVCVQRISMDCPPFLVKVQSFRG